MLRVFVETGLPPGFPLLAGSEEVKSEDPPEGRVNGEKEAQEEAEEGVRTEEKNGCKARFMFNIADGGFTGEDCHHTGDGPAYGCWC